MFYIYHKIPLPYNYITPMKKLFLLGLFITLFAACKKDHTPTPPAPANKIAGRWDIAYITTILRDSLGVTIPGGVLVYPATAGMYYQFNDDNTWTEAGNPTGIISSGNYLLKSDKQLIFSNPHITTQTYDCHISDLSVNRFVFSLKEATKLTPTTSGTAEYIIELKR